MRDIALVSWIRPLTLWAGVGLLVSVAFSPFAIAAGGDEFADIARSRLFQVSFVITMTAGFLLVLAFAALWAGRGHPRSAIGNLGFACAVLGGILLFAIAWAVVAIIPDVAKEAPSVVDPPPGPVFVSFAAIGILWLVFAVALWVRKLFTTIIRVFVTLAALLGIGPLLPVGLAVMGIALILVSRSDSGSAWDDQQSGGESSILT